MEQTPELSVSETFGCDIPRNYILQAQSMYGIIAIEETPNLFNWKIRYLLVIKGVRIYWNLPHCIHVILPKIIAAAVYFCSLSTDLHKRSTRVTNSESKIL